ncbi:MAG TPA: hypothetical protein PKD25_02775 [Rubrivivax sp.]|nr:hypothetical protein [Rubrivivax sp.]
MTDPYPSQYITPRRLAAPAPPLRDDDDRADEPAQTQRDRDLHAVCEAWVRWRHSRRLYGPPSNMPSLLGRLTTRSLAARAPGGPDAPCSAELYAFHAAYLAQPEDSLDRQVFELHYWHRVKPIKTAAAALGISRKHWYVLLGAFRARVYGEAARLAEQDAATGAAEKGRTCETQ